MRLKVSNVCQLINKAKIDATKTVYGVTFTNDGSGVVIANGGPSTGQGAFYVNRAVVIDPTHIYLNPKSADIPGTCALGCDLYGDSGYIPGSEVGFNRDVPFKFNSQGKTAVFYYVIFANKTVSNLRLIPQLFDLTEMYGIGNEPTTVAQFRQDFPNEMYEYSPVCWKKFRRLKYVTETKNLMTDEMFTSAGFTKQSDGSWYIPNTTTLNQKVLWENTEGIAGPVVISLYGKSPQPNAVGVMQFLVTFTDGDTQFINGTGSSDVWAYSEPVVPNPTKTIAKIQWVNITGRPLYLRDVMFEWGSTATPYQPYGYLPLRRGKFIANKEPVQLLDKSEFRETFVNNGMTFTNNADGTFTLNGTTTSASGSSIYLGDSTECIVKANHKYLMTGFPIAFNGSNYAYFQYYPYFTTIKYYILNNSNGYLFFTPAYDGNRWNIFYNFRTADFTIDNVTVKPQLFDLTEMYGEGNEPTTIEQFRADYPNELYDYNPYNAITFR